MMRKLDSRSLRPLRFQFVLLLSVVMAVFSALTSLAQTKVQPDSSKSIQAPSVKTQSVKTQSVKTQSARIVIYGAFAYAQKVHILGRVVEDHAVLARTQRGRVANIVENLRSMETDEVRNVDIDVVIEEKLAGGDIHQEVTLQADDEGLFHLRADQLVVSDVFDEKEITASLQIRSTTHHAGVVKTNVTSVRPGLSPVVVSDFDDTLAKSYAAHKAKLALEVLSKNASQLVMVEGAANVFSKAAASTGGGESTKVAVFFYLSSSPLSFFDRIQDFLKLHGFPPGTILLKDYGAESITDHHGYKTRRIEMLLKALPDKTFILVGDAGEADPEIYGLLKKNHPQRIQRIVIRIPKDTSDEKKAAKRFIGMTVIDDYTRDFSLLAPKASD